MRHAFEDMFYLFGVDLIVTSQLGGYERNWPQYKGVLVETSYSEPRAPVEVILGSSSLDIEIAGNNHTGKI